MSLKARHPLHSGRIAALLSVLLLAACTSTPPAVPPQAPAPEIVTPAPAVPVTVAPPPAPPAPRFAGHIASYKTLAEAEAAWPKLVERYPTVRDTAHRYVEVDLGGQRGKVVRLLLGGFADQAGALSYCRSLRGSGLYCAPHDLPAAQSQATQPQITQPGTTQPQTPQPQTPPQAQPQSQVKNQAA